MLMIELRGPAQFETSLSEGLLMAKNFHRNIADGKVDNLGIRLHAPRLLSAFGAVLRLGGIASPGYGHPEEAQIDGKTHLIRKTPPLPDVNGEDFSNGVMWIAYSRLRGSDKPHYGIPLLPREIEFSKDGIDIKSNYINNVHKLTPPGKHLQRKYKIAAMGFQDDGTRESFAIDLGPVRDFAVYYSDGDPLYRGRISEREKEKLLEVDTSHFRQMPAINASLRLSDRLGPIVDNLLNAQNNA